MHHPAPDPGRQRSGTFEEMLAVIHGQEDADAGFAAFVMSAVWAANGRDAAEASRLSRA